MIHRKTIIGVIIVILLFLFSLKIIIDNKDFDGVYYTSNLSFETKSQLRSIGVSFINSKPLIQHGHSKISWDKFFAECGKNLHVCNYYNEPNMSWFSLNAPRSYTKDKVDGKYSLVWTGDERCTFNKKTKFWYDKDNKKCDYILVTQIDFDKNMKPLDLRFTESKVDVFLIVD